LLIASAIAGQEFYALLTLRYFRPRLEPVADWIAGNRSEQTAVAAGGDASRHSSSCAFGGAVAIRSSAGLVWCLFAVWLLSLPAWGILVLYLAAFVVLAYANGLAFLIFERALQPVLDDIATDVSDEAEIEPSAFASRRLLSALPAVSAGVGVLVVGLVEGGHPGLGSCSRRLLSRWLWR